MNKKEKKAAILMTVTIFMLIASHIYTAINNKPEGYKFNIENWVSKISINSFKK